MDERKCWKSKRMRERGRTTGPWYLADKPRGIAETSNIYFNTTLLENIKKKTLHKRQLQEITLLAIVTIQKKL